MSLRRITHSTSLRASGSEIVPSTSVASSGLLAHEIDRLLDRSEIDRRRRRGSSAIGKVRGGRAGAPAMRAATAAHQCGELRGTAGTEAVGKTVATMTARAIGRRACAPGRRDACAGEPFAGCVLFGLGRAVGPRRGSVTGGSRRGIGLAGQAGNGSRATMSRTAVTSTDPPGATPPSRDPGDTLFGRQD